MGVEEVIERMSEAFDEPYLFVCDSCGHVGDAGKKKKHSEVRTGICAECGGQTTLRATTVSGKKRRPHSLRKFEEREGAESQGPIVQLEPLPAGFELSDRQLTELAQGARPVIAMAKSETIAPLHPGHVYEAGEVDLFVTGVRDKDGGLVVDYLVHRTEQAIREDAPIVERGATRQGRWVDLRTGEEHRAVPEAERLSKAETNELTREVTERELARHKEVRAKAAALLQELERDYGRDDCWPAKKQVDRLDARVEASEERIRELSRGGRKK